MSKKPAELLSSFLHLESGLSNEEVAKKSFLLPLNYLALVSQY